MEKNMTEEKWKAFCKFKTEYKSLCENWKNLSCKLEPLQKLASEKDTPEYPLENAVVYNTAYDAITEKDEIKLIVIGDNPGKDEQLNAKQSYLVGQSGKIAQGFFARNPELGIEFRKNAIIMNKTPIHTAKTKHIKYLLKNGDEEIRNLISESQKKCAVLTAELHKSLGCSLYLVGYAELKSKGIFSEYRDEFKNQYENSSFWNDVYVYQHFSMNRFLVDLKNFRDENKNLSLEDALKILGHNHRDEIFINKLNTRTVYKVINF